jgi:hypothetical protein
MENPGCQFAMPIGGMLLELDRVPSGSMISKIHGQKKRVHVGSTAAAAVGAAASSVLQANINSKRFQPSLS